MKTLEHVLDCGCIITLAVGGEGELAVIADDTNGIDYCNLHCEAEDRSVDINHEFKMCGCEVDLTVTIAADPDDDPWVTSGDLQFCDDHGFPDRQIPDAALENIQLLAEGKHSLTCPRDQWCDCVTHLAGSIAGAIQYGQMETI